MWSTKKILVGKVLCRKCIYRFSVQHFLIGYIVFVLNVKKLLKSQKVHVEWEIYEFLWRKNCFPVTWCEIPKTSSVEPTTLLAEPPRLSTLNFMSSGFLLIVAHATLPYRTSGDVPLAGTRFFHPWNAYRDLYSSSRVCRRMRRASNTPQTWAWEELPCQGWA